MNGRSSSATRTTGSRIVLNVDEVHFQVMKEQAAQSAALISGSIHMMFTVSMDVVPQLQSNPNTSVAVKESGAFTDLVTNTQLEPFQDNRVRTAFKLIADRSGVAAGGVLRLRIAR